MGDVSAEPSMEDILSSIKRIIAEDGEAQPARARRAPRPIVPAGPREDEEREILELSELAPEPVHDEPPAAADPIVSPTAAQASRGSLDALTRMIRRPDAEPTPAEPDKSMESFVADLLRPMLRDWLDANLPEMVEAMVAKEIARITGSR